MTGVVFVMSGRWPEGQRPAAANAVRLHESVGWGRPAVSETTVFYLSKAHQLFAVDRATGAEQWRQSLGQGRAPTAGSTVVLAADTVIAGDDDLFAFDRQTGASHWRTVDETGAMPGRFLGAVHDGMVFAGSATGSLIALRASTGREHWRTSLSGGQVTVFAPVVDRELVVAAFTDFGTSPRSGGIVAVGLVDGRQRWLVRFPRTSTVRAASAAGPPVVTAEQVAAASTDGTVYLLSRMTGHVQWSVPPQLPMMSAAAPAMGLPIGEPGAALMTEHEDFRLVGALGSRLIITSLTGVLTAVDLETRDTVWQYQSPRDGSNGFGLHVRGETAYVPFASGRLAVVDANSGRARQVIGGPTQRFDWPPAVSDDRLYLTSEDGLYVVDLE